MDNYELLLARLNALLKRQDQMSRDIESLRSDIANLSKAENITEKTSEYRSTPYVSQREESIAMPSKTVAEEHAASSGSKQNRSNLKLNIERFIGENLISKIGIIITIIGVAIGIKYSIEHDLISNITRTILGYLFGAALFGLGLKLKKNYTNYSSVLVSGAIAIMYFMTYASYTFYLIMPHALAFALMVAFTVSAVYIAINYNRQVIAIIGLVGAYAIPFLLSNNSGNIASLFIYIAIINVGILAISIAKYWRPLFYTAFAATWIIYEFCFIIKLLPDDSFSLSFSFLIIFFLIFYFTSLGYKFIHCKLFDRADIMLLLINTFILYRTGSLILDNQFPLDYGKATFLISISMLYGATSVIVYKRKEADQNLFNLTAGLAILFFTIFVFFAFKNINTNWITLIWAGEALALFAVGCIRNVDKCKIVSYPIMILSFCSILFEWTYEYSRSTPFFNDIFICTLFYVCIFAAISILYYKKSNGSKSIIPGIIIAGILIVSSYMLFYLEIHHIQQNYTDSLVAKIDSLTSGNALADKQQEALIRFQIGNSIVYECIARICYTMLFVCAILYLNATKVRNKMLGTFALFAAAYAILVFLTLGLNELSSLHSSAFRHASNWRFSLRYLSFAIAALLVFCAYKQARNQGSSQKLLIALDLIAYTVAIWILSSELLNIYSYLNSVNPYRLGLSILWGVCAFVLVGIGIIQKKKHLRIGAFVLFAVTLIKLFAYDLSHLSALSKTIVLVLLGILLLIISFIYNKYKDKISEQ